MVKVFWARGGEKRSPVTGTARSAAATAVLSSVCPRTDWRSGGAGDQAKKKKCEITTEDKLSLWSRNEYLKNRYKEKDK